MKDKIIEKQHHIRRHFLAFIKAIFKEAIFAS